MGSGKTTLGRALSVRLPHYRFIDLDEEIERRAGMTVKEIFSSRGEDEFRRMERETLAEVCRQHDLIVACGGGTPCRQGNMELMNASGTTVLLEASDSVLVRRLLEAQDQRPLLAGLDEEGLRDFVGRLQAERAEFYSLASARFPSELLESEEEVEHSCRRFIEEFNLGEGR